jgi:RNA polymerase sigma factor (sigma-70 family)
MLASLVQLRGAALKGYGYLLCGDDGEAEDLMQDALIRAFATSRQSDIVHAERYVRKVMLNLYLDRVRRRQVWKRLLPLAVASTAPQRDQHGDTDLRGDLHRALLELSPRQRACVVLHYYLDLTVLEISENLGLSGPSRKSFGG